MLNDKRPRKTDRRILRTRTLLLSALMELITERGFESITIQDITDRANVARTTFYLHYASKEELLFQGLYAQYEDLLQKIEPGKMDSTADWQHLAKHSEFYKTMFGEKGSQFFTVQILNFLETLMLKQVVLPRKGEQSLLPDEMVAAYLAGAQYGLWRWWLTNNQPIPIEEVAEAGQSLAERGLYQIY